MSYTVAIVDDHILLSHALGSLVNSFKNFNVSYVCTNGKALLKELSTNPQEPDIILMDINMPQLNGIETTLLLKSQYPNIKVLALSVEEDEGLILRMLRSGARGYLQKDIDTEEFELALLQTMEKGNYFTDAVTNTLVGSMHINRNSIELKEREIVFLKLACTEMTYKEIANEMLLSPKTIEGYRDALHDKLGVKNRIGLVLYAIRNKYFTP